MFSLSATTLRRSVLAGVTALVIGGAALGVASAQQAPNTDKQARQQQIITLAAQALGIPQDKLQTALTDARKQVNQQDGQQMGILKDLRKVAADTLRLTPKQLRQQIAGKTLTDVAKANSVDPAALASALKTSATAKIDQLVKDQKLDQERATKLKAGLDARIQKVMTRQYQAAGTRSAP